MTEQDTTADTTRDDHEAYYERAAWSVGDPVQDSNDPARRGTLVRQCARLWVDRDRRPPLVRWHGTIDAVPIPWYELCRPTDTSLLGKNVTAAIAAIIEQAPPGRDCRDCAPGQLACARHIAEHLVEAVRMERLVIMPVDDADAVLLAAANSTDAAARRWIAADRRHEWNRAPEGGVQQCVFCHAPRPAYGQGLAASACPRPGRTTAPATSEATEPPNGGVR